MNFIDSDLVRVEGTSSFEALAELTAGEVSGTEENSAQMSGGMLKFSSIGIKSQRLKHPPNRKTEVTDAWFAVHTGRIDRDSVEFLHSYRILRVAFNANLSLANLLIVQEKFNFPFPRHGVAVYAGGI